MLSEIVLSISLEKGSFDNKIRWAVRTASVADLVSTEYMLKSNPNSYETNPLGQTSLRRVGLKIAQNEAYSFVSKKAESHKKTKWFVRLVGFALIGLQVKDTCKNLRIAHEQ